MTLIPIKTMSKLLKKMRLNEVARDSEISRTTLNRIMKTPNDNFTIDTQMKLDLFFREYFKGVKRYVR